MTDTSGKSTWVRAASQLTVVMPSRLSRVTAATARVSNLAPCTNSSGSPWRSCTATPASRMLFRPVRRWPVVRRARRAFQPTSARIGASVSKTGGGAVLAASGTARTCAPAGTSTVDGGGCCLRIGSTIA